MSGSISKRPNFWLLMQYSTISFFTSASIYTLVVMALLRCYAIKKPLNYKMISTKKLHIYLACAWFAGLIIVVLLFLYDNISSAFSKSIYLGYLGMTIFCFNYIIPFALLLVSTIAMLVVFLWNEHKSAVNAIGTVSNERNHRKMVKTTILMVCGYGLTCLPYIVSLTQYFFQEGVMVSSINSPPFLLSTILLSNLTCIIDIVIYSALDEHFCTHVKDLYKKMI